MEYSGAVEAKSGFFSIFSERWFVLSEEELRWFDKQKDSENNFPPEKTMPLHEIVTITLLPGNDKWQGQFELVSTGDVKWEMRCKTREEAQAWVDRLPNRAPVQMTEGGETHMSEAPGSPTEEISLSMHDFQEMQRRLREATHELSILRGDNLQQPAESEDNGEPRSAQPDSQEMVLQQRIKRLVAELDVVRASLGRSEQSNASLAGQLCDQDGSFAAMEERALAAEAQAVRLTELMSIEQGEVARGEGEAAKQVKLMEADKRVLKDAMEGQIRTLQDRIAALEAEMAKAETEAEAEAGRVAEAHKAAIGELESSFQECKEALARAMEDKTEQRSNYRMELDATRAQLQVRDAELEASREEESKLNKLLFEVQEQLRLTELKVQLAEELQGQREQLQEQLQQEQQAHAATKEEQSRDIAVKSKGANKKVAVAQAELTKTLITLENTVTQLRSSEEQCEKLKHEVSLLQVHTEQIMHAWNQERVSGRGRRKSDADDKFAKLAQIQGAISDGADELREVAGAEISSQLRDDVDAFSGVAEYNTEKRARTAEAEVERLERKVQELTTQLELPEAKQEDVRTMRMISVLKEERAQAKKEKHEAISGMLLTEQDNEKLKEELAASNAHITQLMNELTKTQQRKKSRNPFKKK